jgi:hypothetical protein
MSSYLNIVNAYNVTPRKNKKIISFAIYGITHFFSKDRGFYKGIFVNFDLAKKVYPGWIIRVYMPHTEPIGHINLLKQMTDIELFLVNTNLCLRAIRFLPNDDPSVDVWISRDLDSIVTFREKAAVDDWLNNYPNKELHIMADSPGHIWTMAGGMFGKKNNMHSSNAFLNFMLNFSNNSPANVYAVDCLIAEQFFYGSNNYIQHCSGGKKLENSVPFPAHDMTNCTFVGDVANIHNYYNVLDIQNKYITPMKLKAKAKAQSQQMMFKIKRLRQIKIQSNQQNGCNFNLNFKN